ncbi:MAG: hypothetical protein WBS19_00830, partial [Candidatus Korobacteraceae bacterium]
MAQFALKLSMPIRRAVQLCEDLWLIAFQRRSFANPIAMMILAALFFGSSLRVLSQVEAVTVSGGPIVASGQVPGQKFT